MTQDGLQKGSAQILIHDAIEERLKGTRLDIAKMENLKHLKTLPVHFLNATHQ